MPFRFKKYYKVLSTLFVFLGITLLFLGGFFSSNTKFEKIAEYATDVVLHHTRNKQLCAVTMEKNHDSGSIPDPITEFHNLYGTFKQEKITFASAVNADKRHNITISDNASDNLSLLYCGPTGSVSYNGHFKHYIFPIETMFGDVDTYSISEYVAYISESHANTLLERANVKKQKNGTYLESDYKTLIMQPLSITIDGEQIVFGICNIYYQSNYYYEGLNDVMGDFIMVSYFLPNNLRSEQQNIYFMSNYTYQNKYFMEYINNVYSSKSYLLKVNHFNVLDEIDDEYLTSFYYSSTIRSLDWLYVLFVAIALSLSLISFLLLCLVDKKSLVVNCFINFLILFIPYIFFFALYSITGDVSFLSEISSKMNVFVILIYTIMISLLIRFRFRAKTSRFVAKDDVCYEINI